MNVAIIGGGNVAGAPARKLAGAGPRAGLGVANLWSALVFGQQHPRRLAFKLLEV